jgi:hypothetical protein
MRDDSSIYKKERPIQVPSTYGFPLCKNIGGSPCSALRFHYALDCTGACRGKKFHLQEKSKYRFHLLIDFHCALRFYLLIVGSIY